MYKKFFGFKEKPFQLVPNPRFLYFSKKHQNAMTHLEYGLSEGSGFILLTGAIGSGKTTIVRHLLNKVEGSIDAEIGVITNTNVDSGELLGLVMHEFGLESNPVSKAKSLDTIFRYLISQYSRKRRVLLVVDEGQNLSVQALEELRMLSNLQTDDQILLQIILIGQPELKRKLNSLELTQLLQRISVFYHLEPLDREEVLEYITYRLEKAGGRKAIFAEDTLDLIYRASGGIPRIVNILCDTALVYAYAESQKTIDSEIVSQVIKDKEGLGLMVGEQADGAAAPAAEAFDGREGSSRLRELEKSVEALKQQVEYCLAEIERLEERADEKLIGSYTELLREERGKSDKLMTDFTMLKAKVSMYLENKKSRSM